MASINRDELDKKVDAIFDQIIAWRRHIHQHPELSFQENETASYIAAELKKLDPEGKHLTITQPVPNGLWADLKGTKGNSNKIILLRADIDGLAVNEETDVPFKSTKAGVGHMCGHDGHAAMLLGAAKLLLAEVEKIDGTVRFLFQPAEEVAPGGAKTMIAKGCVEGVTMAFAEHILPLPNAPTGAVLVRNGVFHNSADNFNIRIIGKGGHASMPELAVDPVAVGSQCVVALQNMVTRRLPSNGAPVLTVTGFISQANTYTIIPEEVHLKGSLRCDNKDIRENALRYFEETLDGVTKSMGATYKLEWDPGYDMCVNDPAAFAVAERAAQQVLQQPDNNVAHLQYALKPADDFAFIQGMVPGNYSGIGCYNEALECTYANHNPKFKVDEECLKVGAKLHYGIIHELLIA